MGIILHSQIWVCFLPALHICGQFVQQGRNIAFCSFNRFITFYCAEEWTDLENEQIALLLPFSVICRSDPHPRFHVPALSSTDTVKCTPCQIANNIMQMMPDTEDSRNSMQISVCAGKLQSSKAVSAECASIRKMPEQRVGGGGSRVHSSQQHKQMYWNRNL